MTILPEWYMRSKLFAEKLKVYPLVYIFVKN